MTAVTTTYRRTYKGVTYAVEKIERNGYQVHRQKPGEPSFPICGARDHEDGVKVVDKIIALLSA